MQYLLLIKKLLVCLPKLDQLEQIIKKLLGLLNRKYGWLLMSLQQCPFYPQFAYTLAIDSFRTLKSLQNGAEFY